VQVVKRSPVNIRPVVGVKPSRSSKGIAYITRGDLIRYSLTKDKKYLDRATEFLDWLQQNSCPGYSGYCWGNHFDYQTRGYFLKKHNPTLVWTALTGRAFAEAFELTGDVAYARVVDSICTFILKDLPLIEHDRGACISYVKDTINPVHNANLLGAGMLSQGYKITGNHDYKNLAERAIIYSVSCQHANGAWCYGEEKKYHWIDNWHTAYNLDAMRIYQETTGDYQFEPALKKGFQFYRSQFFLEDGTPKFYWDKTYPLDIQCASQSIDTLLSFVNDEVGSGRLAAQVAAWTLDNMQDRSGYFYHFRTEWYTNRTPTLHWGQGTMYYALAKLLDFLLVRGEM
jgi:hypothetical protein